jgi:hypothetical protein
VVGHDDRGTGGRTRARSAGVRLALIAGWLLVVLTALASGGVAATADEGDGPGTDTAGLPDRVWIPAGQVLALEAGDAFEPVVVLMTGVERRAGVFDSGPAVAVVGESGAYRFLDLERLARALNRHDGRVGLSADGSRLVWVEPEGPVTVRVWEAQSGEVETYELSGVSDQHKPKLTMSPDGSRIALQVAELRGDTYRKSTQVMDLETGELRRLAPCSAPIGWSHDGEVLCTGRVLTAVSADTARVRRLGEFPELSWPVLLSPDERFATATSAAGDEPVVVDLGSGRQQPLTTVDAPEQERPVAGWVDARTAVVVDRDTGLVAVDVVDGTSQTLVEVPRQVLDHPGFTVAPALLAEPPYAAAEPDWPMDPRVQILIVLGVLAAALVGTLLVGELLMPSGRRRLFRRRS